MPIKSLHHGKNKSRSSSSYSQTARMVKKLHSIHFVVMIVMVLSIFKKFKINLRQIFIQMDIFGGKRTYIRQQVLAITGQGSRAASSFFYSVSPNFAVFKAFTGVKTNNDMTMTWFTFLALQAFLRLMLSSIEIVFHRCCILLRSSSIIVIFH